MITICSYCGDVIKKDEKQDKKISHGICIPCYKKVVIKFGLKNNS